MIYTDLTKKAMRIVTFTLFVLGVNTILWLEQIGNSFFSVGIDLSMIVLFVFISFIVLPLTKLILRKSPWAYMIPVGFGILYILFLEVSRITLYGVETIKSILDNSLTMVPNLTVIILYIGLVFGLLYIKNALNKHLIKRG